jgi:hypothetical protein
MILCIAPTFLLIKGMKKKKIWEMKRRRMENVPTKWVAFVPIPCGM